MPPKRKFVPKKDPTTAAAAPANKVVKRAKPHTAGFCFTLENPKPLCDIITGINGSIDSITLDVRKNSLSFQSMDDSHVWVVEMDFKESAFSDFTIDRPAYAVSVKVGVFSKLLKLVHSADRITVSYDPKNSENLVVTVNESQLASYEYTIQLFDKECDRMDIPDDFSSYHHIRISSAALKLLFESLDGDTSIVSVEILEDRVIFRLKGEMTSVTRTFYDPKTLIENEYTNLLKSATNLEDDDDDDEDEDPDQDEDEIDFSHAKFAKKNPRSNVRKISSSRKEELRASVVEKYESMDEREKISLDFNQELGPLSPPIILSFKSAKIGASLYKNYPHIDMWFKEVMPMKLEGTMPEGRGSSRFYLAPRNEEAD